MVFPIFTNLHNSDILACKCAVRIVSKTRGRGMASIAFHTLSNYKLNLQIPFFYFFLLLQFLETTLAVLKVVQDHRL